MPVITHAACQGDVSIMRVTTQAATTPLPQTGLPVVRGEAGGNTHSLHGDGDAFFDAVQLPSTDDDDTIDAHTSLVLGTLTVPDGAAAYLLHSEHGGMQIAPGTYQIGRQREYANEWRAVAD